ncbi:hypothetical protein [Fibrobacter sp. UWP2]|jgi:long-chain fatty acid transport protein|uniref:hypothetical protein n=1 Tax=Fibrobacter sp. UWP2 TaxID=1896216 RepID=UPI00091E7634|nr:hypothetical protein [Fibrobacter sp. UWP2]SHI77508.1 long-chain fatty acid transport protein [Fibrobacter sp. UWP2]
MKKILSVLLFAAACASASMLGLDALGEEQTLGGMASAAGRGFAGGAKTGEAEGISLSNPARIAFDSKVVFNINFLMDILSIEQGGSYYSTNNVTIPSFNLSFPMGSFGAMGVSLWQHYASIMDEEVEDTTTSAMATFKYQSSVYEIVPNYAVRIPYFRNFSLGASAHFVMGSAERNLTLGPNNSEIPEDESWATTGSKITDHVEGTWEIKNHPAYYSIALQYRGRQSSYYFSFTTPYTLQNDLEYNLRFSELDTLVPTKYTREIDVPMTLATGMNFRFKKRYNVMADLQWRAWDGDIETIGKSFDMPDAIETQNDVLAAVGFQRDGSPLFYDPYLDRMTYRAGAWYKGWYMESVHELGGSIGAGFPLGRKGTTVDLAIQGGKRFVDNGRDWEETFIGLRLGLMGIGNWGQAR